MLKQAIRRVYPGFNEGYYGYAIFPTCWKTPPRAR